MHSKAQIQPAPIPSPWLTPEQPADAPAGPAAHAHHDWVLQAENLGKMYQLFDKPTDRLKQALSLGSRTYYREFWALRNLNFGVRKGEVLGIIGRNGSGKSTLLQILAGILRPSTGLFRRRGRVAALLELGSGFNPDFTGRENIYMNGAILGLPRRQLEERISSIIEFADIGPFIDQPVKTYSSGMFVRLAFSIATNVDADILVVDEALAVGDAAFQFKCMHHVEKMVSSGTTILLVSHDVNMIRSYCTRALYLQGGELKFQGDCETATEMYMMEVKDVQARQFEHSVQQKDGGNGLDRVTRFGTTRGHIRRVTMGSGSQSRMVVRGGERVWFRVEADVDASIREVSINIQLRNTRGQVLFAQNNGHSKLKLCPAGRGKVAVEFEIDCLLQEGHYSLTVRLDDASDPLADLLLEKAVSVLVFEVARSDRLFNGIIDLHGLCRELPSPGNA